ncbi:STE3-domain-containing protein [Trametopsis cervina]|nr:STE3-domain-containing protein [Trametopsis cervina]
MDPVLQALTAASCISAILVWIPAYWHFKAGNVGCLLLITWIVTLSLMQVICNLVWRDNAYDMLPVWCEIVIRFRFAAGYGIPLADLIISRRLYLIANTKTVSNTRWDKRRAALVDLAIGLTLPIASMGLLWFIQGHRYDILEGYGPAVAIPPTAISLILQSVPIVVISLMSAIYSVLSLRIFLRRREQFKDLLSSSGVAPSLYIRLMALCLVEIVVELPLSIWIMVRMATVPFYPYRGLADLHWGFNRVFLYPIAQWLPLSGYSVTISAWLVAGTGIVFFCLFGFAEEARTHYRLAFSTVAKKLGYATTAGSFDSSRGYSSKGSKVGATIPSFIQRGTRTRSISSFDDELSAGDFDTLDIEEKKAYQASDASFVSSEPVTPVDGVYVHHTQQVKVDLAEQQPTSDFIDIEARVHRHEPQPDVPSSVRDSLHMV